MSRRGRGGGRIDSRRQRAGLDGLASLAPLVAVALWAAAGGQPWLVGLYLSGSAVLTLIALALSKETKDVDYDTNIGLGETGSL